MKYLTKHTNILASMVATSAAYAALLGALFLFAGISVAHADTTYVVDATTPNGSCGTLCQQLQAYLNGGSTNNAAVTEGNANYIPTQSPFFSTYGAPTAPAANPAYGNGNQTPASTGNPAQRVYTYYQNPNPSAAPTNSGYGQAPTQQAPYTNYGSGGYGSTGYQTYGQNGTNGAYPAYGSSSYTPAPQLIYVPYGKGGSTTAGSPTAYNPYAPAASSNKGFIRTSGF